METVILNKVKSFMNPQQKQKPILTRAASGKKSVNSIYQEKYKNVFGITAHILNDNKEKKTNVSSNCNPESVVMIPAIKRRK